jgi:hypothetical protein
MDVALGYPQSMLNALSISTLSTGHLDAMN